MVRLVFLVIFSLGFFSNCNSPTPTNDQPPKEPEGIALARMIWPVGIRMDKYPALGDTVEIEVKFRFIRKDDPTPDAEHLRQFLEDSIFTQHDSLYVTGSFHFSRYRRHDKPSDALKYVSGASLFGAWMTLSDSGSFGARYKAIKVDTVMIGALLRIPYGGGFKHECCVIQENNAFGLGDCWEKH